MNDVTIFRKDEFGAVRAVTLKGEPWFVAADVCRAPVQEAMVLC